MAFLGNQLMSHTYHQILHSMSENVNVDFCPGHSRISHRTVCFPLTIPLLIFVLCCSDGTLQMNDVGTVGGSGVNGLASGEAVARIMAVGHTDGIVRSLTLL